MMKKKIQSEILEILFSKIFDLISLVAGGRLLGCKVGQETDRRCNYHHQVSQRHAQDPEKKNFQEK